MRRSYFSVCAYALVLLPFFLFIAALLCLVWERSSALLLCFLPFQYLCVLGAPFPHSPDTGVGTGKSPQPFSACTAGALSRRTAQCSAKHPAFERGGPKANG